MVCLPCRYLVLAHVDYNYVSISSYTYCWCSVNSYNTIITFQTGKRSIFAINSVNIDLHKKSSISSVTVAFIKSRDTTIYVRVYWGPGQCCMGTYNWLQYFVKVKNGFIIVLCNYRSVDVIRGFLYPSTYNVSIITTSNTILVII